MRTTKLLFGLLGLIAPISLPQTTAHADRRSGLAGNLLIDDPDDLFPFPQYTLLHRNMIRLDYGGSATSGNGVLTLGNDVHALGFALHRGDLLTADVVGFGQELQWLGGVSSPFGQSSFGNFPGPDLDANNSPDFALPATVIDLSYGRAVADGAFGARVGFGRGVRLLRDADDQVDKGAQTFLALQAGYSSLPLAGLRYDLAGNFALAFGKAVAADSDVASGFDIRVSGLGRAYYPLNQFVEVGLLGNLLFADEHSSRELDSAESNDFLFGLMAAIGPVIRLDRASIAAYGGVRLELGKNDPNSDEPDESNLLRFAAPTFNMAAEVQLLDWLYVRTGAEYTWSVNRAGSDAETARTSDGAFRWSAGLGAQRGSFYFDGVVQNAFVTGGPDFIGGNANGFLAMASLTYKFGDVFASGSSSSQRALPEPEPAPAPAPAPPPAPAPEPAPVTQEPEPSVEPEQELSPPSVEPPAASPRRRRRLDGGGDPALEPR